MGYTTDFDGSLKISRPLTQKQTKYINAINATRRMKRDVNKLMDTYKGKHGNPSAKDKTNAQEVYGHQGEFFAKDDGDFGQGDDGTVLDHNCPPGQVGFAQGRVAKGQPGLWCQWGVNEDGDVLQWDGGEKFYNYIEWLEYLIKNFFIPWGRKLNGEIYWYGEDRDDCGKIKVRNNEVFTFEGQIQYKDDED
jgi:hypothetical protein